MSLQSRLDAFRAGFAQQVLPSGVPLDLHPIALGALADLLTSRAGDRALQAGDRAPIFMLTGADGRRLSSAGLVTSGPLVVVFQRGGWCPYDSMELQALQEALPAYRAAGAGLVVISPQTAHGARRAVRENGIEFPVLRDPGNKTAASFGLRYALPANLSALYREHGFDLARLNGEASWTLPLTSRFVIGCDGIIRYSEVNLDLGCRPEPEALLPMLVSAVAQTRIRAHHLGDGL